MTDHKPLIWLLNFKEPNSKIIRWGLWLLEYEFETIFKKGSQNVITGALTRADVNLNHNEMIPEPAPKPPYIRQTSQRISPDNKHLTVTHLKEKIRREYYKPLFDFTGCANILKQKLKPNKTCAVFADESILKTLEHVYAVIFPITQHLNKLAFSSRKYQIIANLILNSTNTLTQWAPNMLT